MQFTKESEAEMKGPPAVSKLLARNPEGIFS
jgi:hypothetical protein